MVVQRAFIEDAEEILALQKLAYQSEAEIYDDYSIPPLTQTPEQIADDFAKQLFLKATIDSRIVGAVRAYAENGTCYIGRLIVHPDFRNRGIGTRLMKEIERCFNETARYELFTGHRSEGNLRLYNRLGYTAFAEKSVSDRLTLVFLEKKTSSINDHERTHPMIAFCGLDCAKCEALIATANNDDALRAKLAKEWTELYNVSIAPEYINCTGCRSTGVKIAYCEHLCEVRKCASGRGVGTCAECPDFSCSHLDEILKMAPDARNTLESLITPLPK